MISSSQNLSCYPICKDPFSKSGGIYRFQGLVLDILGPLFPYLWEQFDLLDVVLSFICPTTGAKPSENLPDAL